VKSLVLLGVTLDNQDAVASQGFRQAIESQGVSDELITGGIPYVFGERYRTEHAEGVEAYTDRFLSTNPNGLIETLRATEERESLIGRLGEIHVPVLVIQGEDDASVAMSEAEKIVAGVGTGKLVRIPGAGHHTPLEAPDEVNAALTDFLGLAG
jgi:pimeloyl-ACP methyl ester carboxylesterase